MPKNRGDGSDSRQQDVSSEVELEIEILGAEARHASGGGSFPREAAGRTPRILVVDHDARVRSYVRRCLEERAGGATEVMEARTGLEALRIALASGVGLVICDAAISVDGQDLVSRLRVDPELARVPVLLTTAESVGRAERERVEDMAAVRLLEKPFNARKLRDAVEGLLAEGGRG